MSTIAIITSGASIITIFIIFILGMKNKNLKDISDVKMKDLRSDFEIFAKSVVSDYKILIKDVQTLDKRTAVDKKEMEGKLESILIEFGTKLNSVEREMQVLNESFRKFIDGGKK